ncbi:methyltransferase [Lojkania enalia]|uniref:Methyltransferase n=1 Tax=Lojkania enalia TaxID=147567 RepID=A0A9P4K3V8_9PLEO|nr:methyltransferase [Didymosphaeria enalia]
MAVVESQMSFLEPWQGKEEGPYVRGKVEENFPNTNFENKEYQVKVHDARERKTDFDLDTHGFAWAEDDGVSKEIVEAIRARNKAAVEEKYYPQVEKLVMKKTGASRIIIFDHTYRKKDPALAKEANPNGREQPATLVHCDQSALGAVRRVHRHAGEDAERLLQGRAQIINVWRPVHGIVEDWALAVMDYRTAKASEIHPTNIFKERYELMGQTVSVNHSPGQKWYYLDRQAMEECTLIKIWDSKEDVARLCAHCAFPNPNAPADAACRESIEVRCLVFYE